MNLTSFLEIIILIIIVIEIYVLTRHARLERKVDKHMKLLDEHMKRLDEHINLLDKHMSKLEECLNENLFNEVPSSKKHLKEQ
jgi:predicted Holliday junction resolvase-like endonuclease